MDVDQVGGYRGGPGARELAPAECVEFFFLEAKVVPEFMKDGYFYLPS